MEWLVIYDNNNNNLTLIIMAPKKKKSTKKGKKSKEPKVEEEKKPEDEEPEYIDPAKNFPIVEIQIKLATPPVDFLSKFKYIKNRLTDMTENVRTNTRVSTIR